MTAPFVPTVRKLSRIGRSPRLHALRLSCLGSTWGQANTMPRLHPARSNGSGARAASPERRRSVKGYHDPAALLCPANIARQFIQHSAKFVQYAMT